MESLDEMPPGISFESLLIITSAVMLGGLFLLFLAIAGLAIIPNGFAAVGVFLERKPKVFRSGVYWNWPFVYRFVTTSFTHPVGSPRTQHSQWSWYLPLGIIRHDPPKQTVLTKQHAQLTLDLNIYSQIESTDESILKAFRATNLWNEFETMILRAAAAIVYQYETAAEVRQNLHSRLLNTPEVATFYETYGLKLVRIEIDELSDDARIQQAKSAEQERLLKLRNDQSRYAEEVQLAQKKAQGDSDLANMQVQAAIKRREIEASAAQTAELVALKSKIERERLAAEAEARNIATISQARHEAAYLEHSSLYRAVSETIGKMDSQAKLRALTAYWWAQAFQLNKSLGTLVAPGGGSNNNNGSDGADAGLSAASAFTVPLLAGLGVRERLPPNPNSLNSE